MPLERTAAAVERGDVKVHSGFARELWKMKDDRTRKAVADHQYLQRSRDHALYRFVGNRRAADLRCLLRGKSAAPRKTRTHRQHDCHHFTTHRPVSHLPTPFFMIDPS
jgi:hypothetical protein